MRAACNAAAFHAVAIHERIRRQGFSRIRGRFQESGPIIESRADIKHF
jgi:hypothetical protein